MPDLLPCPFCGHKATETTVIDYREDPQEKDYIPMVAVRCYNCGATGPFAAHSSDNNQLIASNLWNMRATMNIYIIPTDDPDLVHIQGNCMVCKEQVIISSIPYNSLTRWRLGELIQVALPKLNADEREFLKTGICGSCFDKLCAEE